MRLSTKGERNKTRQGAERIGVEIDDYLQIGS